MSATPAVSVVIRSYNEERLLGQLLKSISEQQGLVSPVEVVLVDSGSTDDTVAIARHYCVDTIVEIPSATFDYSDALNLGIARSRGDLIVILSAHAIPTSLSWLRLMVRHFDDPSVGGVFSRQIPWPGAPWSEVYRLKVQFGREGHAYRNAPATRVPFSNAASCIRRSLWESRNFLLPAAEDVEWATWMVNANHAIIYDAEACVYHSHDESPRQAARRLVQLEDAAALATGRRRGRLVIARQALAFALRDIRQILKDPDAGDGRLRHATFSISRSFWFLHESRVHANRRMLAARLP